MKGILKDSYHDFSIKFQLKILNWIEQEKRPRLVIDVNEMILKNTQHQTVPLIVKHFFYLIH